MKYFYFFICLSFLSTGFSQNDSLIQNFEKQKNKINHNGMIVLTAWSAANIAGSAVGYGLANSYEEKQFYIMNGAWGVVNLSIALPGLLLKSKKPASVYELQKGQTKTEKIFLANAMLDIVYITGGLALKQYASNQNNLQKQQQFNGFANAIMIQGAGLMVFDIAMTVLNNRHRKKHLDPILKNATITFTGNSFGLNYRFN